MGGHELQSFRHTSQVCTSLDQQQGKRSLPGQQKVGHQTAWLSIGPRPIGGLA